MRSVGQVERFDTSLQLISLGEREVLEKGSIKVTVVWAVDRVSPSGANRSDCLTSKSSRIEPSGDAVVDVVGIVQLVRTVVSSARTRHGHGIGHTEREARLPDVDTVELPTANHPLLVAGSILP